MKYRTKVTHCVSQIKNINKYAAAHILKDAHDLWIDVDTEEEAAQIEVFDHYMGMAIEKYMKLVELTLK